MSANFEKKPSTSISYKGLCMGLGIIFGGLVGVFIGNPIIFAGGGLVLGFAIGSAIDNRK